MLDGVGGRGFIAAMGVNLVVAVTDRDWFDHLRGRPDLVEVNFWAPSASSFKALQPGELFLFKLHAPHNYIVGGGVFAYANELPCSLAWEAFGEANGARTLGEMRSRIAQYRRAEERDRSDFKIGCRILTQPFFLSEHEWIPVPSSWSPNIVKFKTYSTADNEGLALWNALNDRKVFGRAAGFAEERTDTDAPRYGQPTLVKPRLGQGAFRVVVTDSYDRRCAVTRERTLPALDAAHIRPFADGGAHERANGLLLRRDLHKLFDDGYVTVDPDLSFVVSKRIKEEFENGRHYYALHGSKIETPKREDWKPSLAGLRWHNESRFRG